MRICISASDISFPTTLYYMVFYPNCNLSFCHNFHKNFESFRKKFDYTRSLTDLIRISLSPGRISLLFKWLAAMISSTLV